MILVTSGQYVKINFHLLCFSEDDGVFAEVVNAEKNIINQLEKKSKCKPLLIFHDESNVINACDVVVEMALQGSIKWCSPF